MRYLVRSDSSSRAKADVEVSNIISEGYEGREEIRWRRVIIVPYQAAGPLFMIASDTLDVFKPLGVRKKVMV